MGEWKKVRIREIFHLEKGKTGKLKKIVIKSQVQAKEVLKMLNDDILFSKLTENDYTSIDKEILKN